MPPEKNGKILTKPYLLAVFQALILEVRYCVERHYPNFSRLCSHRKKNLTYTLELIRRINTFSITLIYLLFLKFQVATICIIQTIKTPI
jgi:hypothetical protein